MALTEYDFTGYANRAAFLAAGWDFQAKSAAGTPRNTESGNATYGSGGMVFPVAGGAMWSENSVDEIFRDLDPDWESVTVELDWFGGYINARHAGLVIYQDDDNFVMAARRQNGDFLGYWSVAGTVSWSDSVAGSSAMGFWLKVSREEDTYALQYSFNGVTFTPITSRTQALTAPRMGIWVGDNNGANDNTATILAASVNVLEPSAGLRIGGALPSIRLGTDVVAAMYLGDVRVYSTVPSGGTPVTFTTTGATFSPAIELVPGSTSTVYWLDADENILATGVTPTIDFGSAATRTVKMVVIDGPVYGFEDVLTINLGYNNAQDPGDFMVGPSYNKDPAEAVASIADVNVCTSLKRLLMSNISGFSGPIDMSGMADLEHAEFFHTPVDSVDLTGCDSMIRLSLEGSSMTSLDLTPVAATLKDLRCAVQTPDTGMTFLLDTGVDMDSLYHYCVRGQIVTQHILLERMPVLEEYWAWDTGVVDTADWGTPVSTVMGDFRGYDQDLTAATVNDLLIAFDTLGAATGSIRIGEEGAGPGSPAAPTGAGITAKSSLIGKGWSVDTA